MPEEEPANWGRFLGLGIEMAAGVGVGLAVGYWLDGRYGWDPYGKIVGAAVGLAAGMYLLIKDAIKLNR